MKENFKKYLVEFIGTLFLVFTIGATAAFEGPGAPIAIGFMLMVMIYAGGHISGGHYNPAVSVAAAVRGALPWKEVIPYSIAQIVGGAVGASLILIMLQGDVLSYADDLSILNIVIAEFLFTFALCYVVLLVATSPKTEGNSYYGLAIGSVVVSGAFAVGGACLGAFNPAVAISTLILGTVCCAGYVWITVLVNLVAAVCAGLIYKVVNND